MFDLDNTLYPEVEYLNIAYRKIADILARKYSLSTNDAFEFLEKEFHVSGRNQLFNKLYDSIGVKNTSIDDEKIFIDHCLSILRNVESSQKISLYNYIYEIFRYLKNNNKQILVITNGNVDQQKNKIKLIDWMGFDNEIDFVFANLFAPKPDPKSFDEYISGKYFLNNESGIFIGDAASDEEYAFNIKKPFMYANDLTLLKF